MTPTAFAALSALLLLAPGCSRADAVPTGADPGARFAEVARILDSAAVALDLEGVSMVVLRGDTVLFDRSVGGVGPATEMPIASASKWISGAVVMSLVDDGVLSLDDSVGRWLPDAPMRMRGITVRQLFSHTSGLPAQAPCLTNPFTSLDDCARQVLALGPVAGPGEVFAYGGASMQVAGRMAEVASGRTWDELLRERITGPLGLVGTGVREANPHVGGGYRSTRDEYGAFLRALLADGDGAGVLLSPGAVAALEADQTRGAALAYSPHPDGGTAYGIGVWVERTDGEGRSVRVSSPGAFGFYPWIDRERGIAVVFAVRSRLPVVRDAVARLQGAVEAAVDARGPEAAARGGRSLTRRSRAGRRARLPPPRATDGRFTFSGPTAMPGGSRSCTTG